MSVNCKNTEKHVQAKIQEIGDDFPTYCMKNFVDFDSMCKHLNEFKDFRVFLPIVCNKHFNHAYFSLLRVENKQSAQAMLVMNNIYHEARYYCLHTDGLKKQFIPEFGNVSMEAVSRLININKVQTARIGSKFFIRELRIGSSKTKFSVNAMEREKVKRFDSFNLLPIEKHYVEGMSPVVEYFMMYGEVLPIFHMQNIKIGDKISVRCLMKALDDREVRTVALHIRAFEEIPETQRSRMRNKLISLGASINEYLSKKDKRYYHAFRNGFYTVGV